MLADLEIDAAILFLGPVERQGEQIASEILEPAEQSSGTRWLPKRSCGF